MNHHPSLHIAILAAGAGTRMRSELPKVLHPLMGKPMLQWVIDAAKPLQPANIWVVTGHQSERIQACIEDPTLQWIEQKPLHGTGHAIMQLYPHLAKKLAPHDQLLILCADSPVLPIDHLRSMIAAGKQHALVLLNLLLTDPTGFGRIIRNANNQITQIVEEKDADNLQKAIQEIYSGTMLIRFDILTQLLPQLTAHNAQKEYYLTQLIELCAQHEIAIESILTSDECAARGVNDRAQLAQLERTMQTQTAVTFMQQGISIVDPTRFDLRGTLHAEQDVRIDINCIIEGTVTIGAGTSIGAHCILKDCQIGRNVTIHPYTMIDSSSIADHATAGPFTRIRPDTVLEEFAHVGSFVEVKKSHLGKYTKANHLAYLGDAILGEHVNIGAGAITANYDGVHKHATQIEDHVFIGSNAVLVAPITIGREATVGAGSVMTKDVPAEHLSLTRSEQKNLKWKRKK